MRLAVDILCKHGGITNLALDFRNFHPALRDILRLEMDKDQTGLSFIQDEEYAEMIDEQMEIAALMSKFPLKTITYIHNGDKDVLQRQTRQKSTLKEHLGQVEVMSTGTLLPGSIEEDNPGLPWLGWLNAVQASKVNLYLQMCQQKNIARDRVGEMREEVRWGNIDAWGWTAISCPHSCSRNTQLPESIVICRRALVGIASEDSAEMKVSQFQRKPCLKLEASTTIHPASSTKANYETKANFNAIRKGKSEKRSSVPLSPLAVPSHTLRMFYKKQQITDATVISFLERYRLLENILVVRPSLLPSFAVEKECGIGVLNQGDIDG
ncbi:hypothetical protein DL98DRAFT_541876 [Cadophora sp. DSE1049]|nr:hypothetical protein DL98DRAFT_541876 [Cadophora sp. DSE1049]